MAFDLESGMGGAQAGLAFGPFGALAGGIIGGLLGGRSKKKAEKKAKKEARRREQMLLQASSPEFLLKTAAGLRPGIRESLLPQSASDVSSIENIIGESGMRETGVGALVRSAASRIPDVRSASESLRQASGIQGMRIAALGGAPTAPTYAPSGISPEAGMSFREGYQDVTGYRDISSALRRAAMPPEVSSDEFSTSPTGRLSYGLPGQEKPYYGPGF